jgi:hypothetical protein
MPASKPNVVTTSYDGQMGDREFVFACKGRPFCVLTAPQFPTPAFTMIDNNLVRELGLSMTDLQCVKMRYGGQNLRILGKISTSVQCIVEGVPVGNMHLKAHVVTDVYQLFNTYAIAGVKLAEKLAGKPHELLADESTTEPTNPARKKRRKKARATRNKNSPDTDDESVSSSPSTPERQATSYSEMDIITTRAYHSMADLHSAMYESPSHRDGSSSLPHPLVQGRWIMKFHCVNSLDPTDITPYYVDRQTGQELYEEPDSWRSNGSMYSYYSGDEYDDVYTNKSSVIKVPTDEDDDYPAVQQITHADQRQDDGAPLMVHTVGPAEARAFPHGLLVKRRMHWNLSGQGEPIPDHLKDIPVPHGSGYCNADCLWIGDVPLECGYNATYGRIFSCCQRCPGAWCGHDRKMGEGVYLGTKETKRVEE